MRIQFHPSAERELESAVELGEARAAGLGAQLLEEAQRILDLLSEAPSIGAPIDARYMRFPLRRFPFAVIYRVEGEFMHVVAFSHRRRLPGYWRNRL